MTKQRASELGRAILHAFVLPAIGFSLGVAVATKRYDWTTVAIGLAMAGVLTLFWQLERAFIEPRLRRVQVDWLQLGLQMASSVLIHLLGASLALFLCSRIFGFAFKPTTAWMVLGGMVAAFPIIHGTETALGYYRQLQEKERVEERLRALATQAELRALKAQINPHFLFNTLNTIAQLIHTDPSQAETTVERLAEMFRYVLSGSERGSVPLEEELAFVDSYLEIERARFGDRLRVTRQVAPGVLDVSVPSLTLQPLVENAVRHGRAEDGSVDLAIRVEPHDKETVIAIADLGPGMPRQRDWGKGHGLRNVDERLRKTYGQEYGLQIGDNVPRGTRVTIRIPTRQGET